MWELEQIAEFGLQSRVVVVLPPPRGRRKRPNMAAVAQARSIVPTVSRVPGKRDPRRWCVSSGTYEAAVIEAIKEIEAEMSDWSFGARYSV
jgi:hypothetical protein